jgi:hypothetical protein
MGRQSTQSNCLFIDRLDRYALHPVLNLTPPSLEASDKSQGHEYDDEILTSI